MYTNNKILKIFYILKYLNILKIYRRVKKHEDFYRSQISTLMYMFNT